METGTGKTYVYLRSIFELHKKYGFSKFIIVVPSLAIKEGVYKSLQMTEQHFKEHYDNVQYDYFIYDSQKLGEVRNSATHKEKYNLLYKLDSIDAYEQKLVKQIEVASINVQDGHNKPYIKLLKVNNKKSPIQAHVEFDLMRGWQGEAGKKMAEKWRRPVRTQ